MAGGTFRLGALALTLGLAAGPALAARIVDPAAARQSIQSTAVVSRDAQLSALAADGHATELAAQLEEIARDTTLIDVAQEYLLDRGLHALARIPPTPNARASVARLTARAPTILARIDPDHGDRATPLYDAGATARFVLRTWDRNAARALAASALAAGSTRPVERFAGSGPAKVAAPERAGITDAFRAAPIAELAAQRAVVADALQGGLRVDALGLILAERLADPALFALVFDYADEAVALAAIPAAAHILDASSALAALARASRRADIASAAMLETGRLAASEAAARHLLYEALADPGLGPSAAAALGRLSDPGVCAELGQRLAKARSEEERRLLVLALRLDPQPAARAELERFAKAGAGSPQLQREVRRWLAR